MSQLRNLINRICLRIARNVYFYYLEERKKGKVGTQNFTTWSNLLLVRYENKK